MGATAALVALGALGAAGIAAATSKDDDKLEDPVKGPRTRAAAEEARKAQGAKKGPQSTILTLGGGGGGLDPASARTTLLGG
jgi:hypothetical protein